MKIIFTFLLSLITLLAAAQQKNQVKIGIFVNESEFFEDYPADTLISHLNLLNEFKGVTYSKVIPEKKTDVDYVVKLKLFLKKSNNFTVSTKENVNYRTEMVAITDPGGQVRYELQSRPYNIENEVIPSSNSKVEHLLNLEIRKASNNKKLRYRQYAAWGNETEETNMIIAMIKYIQSFTEKEYSRVVKK